jgi:hypothetical protein
MRKIFRAYILRNPVVGYTQGMNFVFFRIRKLLSEEDTFWMMCLIIETYLPPDFYIEMIGLKTHSIVLEKLIRK